MYKNLTPPEALNISQTHFQKRKKKIPNQQIFKIQIKSSVLLWKLPEACLVDTLNTLPATATAHRRASRPTQPLHTPPETRRRLNRTVLHTPLHPTEHLLHPTEHLLLPTLPLLGRSHQRTSTRHTATVALLQSMEEAILRQEVTVARSLLCFRRRFHRVQILTSWLVFKWLIKIEVGLLMIKSYRERFLRIMRASV